MITSHGSPEFLPISTLGPSLGGYHLPDSADFVGFSSIPGGVLIPGGGAAVVDGQEKKVYVFDGNGSLTVAFGREGEGPGELRFPTKISLVNGDTLAVFDRRNRRMSLLASDGSLVGSIDMSGSFRPLDGWINANGSAGFSSFTQRVEQGRPTPEGAMIQPLSFCLQRQGTGVDTFCFIGAEELVSGVHHLPVPFGSRPSVDVSGQGLILSTGPLFEILILDSRLTRRTIIRWPDHDQPVTEAGLEAALAELNGLEAGGQQGELVEQMFSTSANPKIKPSIGMVVAADDGEIWVGLAEPFYGVSGDWIIMNPRGVPLGKITLPPKSRVLDVRGSEFLVTHPDSFDVPVVERFRRPKFR